MRSPGVRLRRKKVSPFWSRVPEFPRCSFRLLTEQCTFNDVIYHSRSSTSPRMKNTCLMRYQRLSFYWTPYSMIFKVLGDSRHDRCTAVVDSASPPSRSTCACTWRRAVQRTVPCKREPDDEASVEIFQYRRERNRKKKSSGSLNGSVHRVCTYAGCRRWSAGVRWWRRWTITPSDCAHCGTWSFITYVASVLDGEESRGKRLLRDCFVCAAR